MAQMIWGQKTNIDNSLLHNWKVQPDMRRFDRLQFGRPSQMVQIQSEGPIPSVLDERVPRMTMAHI